MSSIHFISILNSWFVNFFCQQFSKLDFITKGNIIFFVMHDVFSKAWVLGDTEKGALVQVILQNWSRKHTDVTDKQCDTM